MKNKPVILFGKYKGKSPEEISDSWFVLMHGRGLLSKELKRYAEDRIPSLKNKFASGFINPGRSIK